MRLLDLSGMRFGRLLVVGRAENRGGRVYWDCVCDCGNAKRVAAVHLSRGLILSCRCLQKEATAAASRTHGKSYSPEYRAWAALIERCTNPKKWNYASYGGRGITVCDRWRTSFENFLADMGPRPSPTHSIDRFPNNDGNYEPGNCRWATKREQALNRRPRRRSIPCKDTAMRILNQRHGGMR